ncbi:glycerol-3-phosphate dehydrogenase Gpd1 [Schizosaccharomyces japonicus yFS275]|uniref:Glycerol-3-phosphate dehydrogenase [NAD(+)] n=1 Tax=Schizosaccharomyces japonicus (strain yFS275 / FY16936) TaxID=402676 RepID=B6JVJ6_SCHJY|nr:glycerol-3-phosphate dehydrogenase Gpd1 [Schizosaccharomyces japonicus yFS275]EEB05397.1 glycerol-3-phosphate dehydrogenase Gpd1 [Schizosaccharomyces japonicus yFS275]
MSTTIATSHNFPPAPPRNKRLSIGIIGSGNWGTAIAKICGENARAHGNHFRSKVRMWVFEEEIEYKGEKRKLTEIFNETHENVKYLPGIPCPSNILAIPDVREVTRKSDVLVFVVPHQFVDRVCEQMKGFVRPNAVAISCIKGVAVNKQGVKLYSEYITERLGIYCGVLSGANVANEVAREDFCETTIGYNPDLGTSVSAEMMVALFDRPYFSVAAVKDVAGVALGGALKNIVSMAVGFADGLEWGGNTKSAIMRRGLLEMQKFATMFFDSDPRTMVEQSCGIADLVTSCLGGRNNRCAEAFVKTGKSLQQLEKELLGGQVLQGAATAADVHELLTSRDLVKEFPLFTTVYRIAYEGMKPEGMIQVLQPPVEESENEFTTETNDD